MHWRGHAAVMQERTAYGDVVVDVVAELAARLDAARAAGIGADRLVVDAGYGFAKTGEHNWALLRRPDALAGLGVPQLVGVSRKAFLGALLAAPTGRRGRRGGATTPRRPSPPCWPGGAWGVRVHRCAPAATPSPSSSGWAVVDPGAPLGAEPGAPLGD